MSDYYSSAPVLMHYAPPQPPPSTARETAGKVLTVLASVFGPPAAAAALFAGLITWSDCFIQCSGNPDHVTGGLLIALAVAMVLTGPVLAAVVVRRASWVFGAVAVPLLEVLVLLAH